MLLEAQMCAWFDRLARRGATLLSSPWALIAFLVSTVVWFLLARWPQAWAQYTALVTILTQVTAMLVLYAQHIQERAMQIKLDELIRSNARADDQLRGIEKGPIDRL